MNQTKIDFVTKLGELLNIAKPNLVSCHLATGAEIIEEHKSEEFFEALHRDIYRDTEHAEYVVVTCEGGYQYFINVSINSLAAIASAVFEYTMYK